MKTLKIISIILVCLATYSCSQKDRAFHDAFDYPSVSMDLYSPDSIKAEMNHLFTQIRAIHPCFGTMVDQEELFQLRQEIQDKIDRPMNQLDVYRLYALYNSVFNDAHNGIMLPKYKDQMYAAIEMGDRIFPLRVFIDKDYRLFVRTPAFDIPAGTEILSINGISAVDITKKLEKVGRGDNADFRRNLVSDRFAEYLWMHCGSSKTFDLEIKDGSNVTSISLDGGTELPPHRSDDLLFEDQYAFEFLEDNQVAYFNTKTFFLPGEYERYYELTDSIFKEIREKGSKYLIIDIRENGGGDDQLWINGIMPYIAKKKWQRVLHFLGRVREIDEAFPGRLGEVAIFDYYGEFEVSDKPKFDGEVYVIVGRKTYSSGIMFSTIIKDNEVGTIVGQEEYTLARGCQTGMMVYHEMKTTGIKAFTPQHWYQRNTEGSCLTGVPVDIQLPDSPFDERQIVKSLVERLISKQ